MIDLSRYPKINATAPTGAVSDKYSFISTMRIADALRDDHGLVPVKVSFSASGAHLVRFRRSDAPTTGEYVPEIALRTAHDGTSAFRIYSGIFRFLCSNGLVMGADITRSRIVHRESGNIRDRVAGIIDLHTSEWSRVDETIDMMRRKTGFDRLDFARRAAELRWPVEEAKRAVVSPRSLLLARRAADRGEDLWSTLNVVQENLTQSGTQLTRRRSRGIADYRAVSLNTKIWDLAKEYA